MLDGNTVNERPDVGELYEVAINATALKPPGLDGDGDAGAMELGRGSVDLLIATRSAHALGIALRRLRGEWNSVAKPARLSAAKVAELAARFKEDDDRQRLNRERENGELARLEALREKTIAEGNGCPWDLAVAIMEQGKLYEAGKLPLPAFRPLESPATRAQREADRWFDNELRILANGLPSRADVWRHLPEVAQRCGLSHDGAAQVLHHWLNPVCPKCHGRRFQLLPGTPALTGKHCPVKGGCGGSGESPMPCGLAGRKLANLLDDFAERAKQSMKHRLRKKR